jgi:hypothetical protein
MSRSQETIGKKEVRNKRKRKEKAQSAQRKSEAKQQF